MVYCILIYLCLGKMRIVLVIVVRVTSGGNARQRPLYKEIHGHFFGGSRELWENFGRPAFAVVDQNLNLL